MQVKKVKTRQKLAEPQTVPGLILAGMRVAQTDVYYYGYWVYDPVADSRLTLSSSIARGLITFRDCRRRVAARH
jgi:hypothetical protein